MQASQGILKSKVQHQAEAMPQLDMHVTGSVQFLPFEAASCPNVTCQLCPKYRPAALAEEQVCFCKTTLIHV